MKIKVPNKNYSIIEFYETVARELGYTITDNIQFDCREINVAKNIQDGFYAYYTELAKETDPDVSEKDVRVEITMLLAIGGPKVDESLQDNEVEVSEKFIDE